MNYWLERKEEKVKELYKDLLDIRSRLRNNGWFTLKDIEVLNYFKELTK